MLSSNKIVWYQQIKEKGKRKETGKKGRNRHTSFAQRFNFTLLRTHEKNFPIHFNRIIQRVENCRKKKRVDQLTRIRTIRRWRIHRFIRRTRDARRRITSGIIRFVRRWIFREYALNVSWWLSWLLRDAAIHKGEVFRRSVDCFVWVAARRPDRARSRGIAVQGVDGTAGRAA